MKKLYMLMIALLIGQTSQATHLMGGELTVEHLGGNNYVIHFQAYRDTIGIPFAMSAQFDVYDSNYLLLSSNVVSQLPSSGGLMPGYPYGVETYFFHDTITVPGPGTYHVEWVNCCRNAAILNLLDPLSENMFLTTTFTNFAGVANSSPGFLAPPVTFLPVGLPWQYNSLPVDPDGDSLVWSVDTPLTGRNLLCQGWATPSAALPADAFVIDPVTGQIDWTPDLLGNFVASILVEEYRAGLKIGEIRRDYQMIVIPDTNKCPRILNTNIIPTNSEGYSYLRVSAGETLSITLHTEDPDGDQVEFLAFGQPFMLPANKAVFTTTPYHITGKSGTFTWTPTDAQANSKPYVVVFRTRDQLFSYDYSVLVYVDRMVSVNPDHNSLGNLWPNPVSDEVILPIELTAASQVSVVVYSITGSKVIAKDYGTLDKGSHQKSLSLNLSAGTYFVQLMVNGSTADTQRLIVGQ